MIYEISNPSDPYTMQSDNEEAAVLACLILGNGHYPLVGLKGENVCPFFFSGASDWFLGKYGRTLEHALEGKQEAVAAALESVLIGTMGERRDYEEAISLMDTDRAAQFKALRHDRHRSSMNDIGHNAEAYAKALRKKLVEAKAVHA